MLPYLPVIFSYTVIRKRSPVTTIVFHRNCIVYGRLRIVLTDLGKIAHLHLGMCGVSDNTEETVTFVTDSDAQCTLIGSVPLITEILITLTLTVTGTPMTMLCH